MAFDDFPVYYCDNSDDESEPMDRMRKVACVLIAPNYDYTGEDKTERTVHKYMQKVKFLPNNLSDKFADEIRHFSDSVSDAQIRLFRIGTQAKFKNVTYAIEEATRLKIEVLCIIFIGHGTEHGGMLLQNRDSMSRVQLHRIINATGFYGTLIEAFCMCYACGSKYQPIADTCGTTQLTPLEKRNIPRVSIFSSTGIAFLKKLRDIMFGSDSKYVDLKPEAFIYPAEELAPTEALTPQGDDVPDEAFDDKQMKKSDVTTVNVCGDLGELLIFEPIPHMV